MLLFSFLFLVAVHAEEKLSLIKKIPHSGYSEGLDFYEGFLWNALPKEIRKIDPANGNVVDSFAPATEYSESLSFLNGKLWNVSFSDNGIYQADPKTRKFKRVGSAPETTAWGLTHNGKELVMTGTYNSPMLYFVSPQTLKVVRKITVTENKSPVTDLEDLAWDGKSLWSSSFSSRRSQVFKINPVTGAIEKTFIISSPEECPVVDGLAIQGKTLWVTGKECPSLYQFRLP